jgi:hypothetical protein
MSALIIAEDTVSKQTHLERLVILVVVHHEAPIAGGVLLSVLERITDGQFDLAIDDLGESTDCLGVRRAATIGLAGLGEIVRTLLHEKRDLLIIFHRKLRVSGPESCIFLGALTAVLVRGREGVELLAAIAETLLPLDGHHSARLVGLGEEGENDNIAFVDRGHSSGMRIEI